MMMGCQPLGLDDEPIVYDEGTTQKTLRGWSEGEQQQNPKSINLMCPLLSIIIFSNLISLWVTNLECRYSNIPRSCFIILFTFSSGKRWST